MSASQGIKLVLCQPINSLSKYFSSAHFHESIDNDVLLGAQMLVASSEQLIEYEATPEDRAHWEWRYFIDCHWLPLPAYVSGVLEAAHRSGEAYACVQMRPFKYLHANLEEFTFCFAEAE